MRRLDRALWIAIVIWAALLAGNDALPYLGLRDDSCQTMFCDMESGADWNTHWLMPQHAVADLWQSLDVADVVVTPPPTDERARASEAWLMRPHRIRNTEAVRVALWQLCSRGHHVAMSVDGVRHEDACADPTLSSPHLWIPVRLYDTDDAAPGWE